MDMSSKTCASQQAAGYLMLFTTNPGLHDFTLFHCVTVISHSGCINSQPGFFCVGRLKHTNRKEERGWDTFTDLQPFFDFLLLNLFSSLLVDTLLCLIACFHVFSCTDIFYWSLERSQLRAAAELHLPSSLRRRIFLLLARSDNFATPGSSFISAILNY